MSAGVSIFVEAVPVYANNKSLITFFQCFLSEAVEQALVLLERRRAPVKQGAVIFP